MRWLAVLVILSFLGATRGLADDRRCNADLVCVEIMRGGTADAVTLLLETTTGKPLTFGLFFSSNLAHLNPAVQRLNGVGEMELVRFAHPGEPWGFDFRIHYGHDPHDHDGEHVYTLPYATGAAFSVTQSHTDLTTHRLGNRYALDWSMPIGQPIHAARDGRVVSTYDSAKAQSFSGSATANHIWIRHSDGTIGKYLHLDHRGVLVKEGQQIEAGARIGTSGATGFARGPHLHFSVSTLGGDAVYRTFDVLFQTSQGPRRLVTGDAYRRPSG